MNQGLILKNPIKGVPNIDLCGGNNMFNSKILSYALGGLLLSTAAVSATAYASSYEYYPKKLHVSSASGASHARFPASNVIDNNRGFRSRFASRANPDDLVLNLGTARRVEDIKVAWGRGHKRSFKFEIAVRANEYVEWSTVYTGQSTGKTRAFETYYLPETTAQLVRIRGLSNSKNTPWTDITEVEVYGQDLPNYGGVVAYEGTEGVSDTFLGSLTGEADYNGRGDEYDQVNYEGSLEDYRIVEADEAGTYLVYKPKTGNDVLVSIDGIHFPDTGETFDIKKFSAPVTPEKPEEDNSTGLTHFGEPITLVGANIPWSTDAGFSSDFGGFNDLNIEAYENRFEQIQAAGGNSARIWLHTTAQVTPAINEDGRVIGLSNVTSDEVVLEQLRSVLDAAWEDGIVVTFSLFSFDMFCDAYGDDFGYTSVQDLERHTDMIETNYDTYIDNALLPIVTGLKDHPGLFAYEVFNEPEGAILNMTGAGHFCPDEANVAGDGLTFPLSLTGAQRFVNRVAAAVHEADPNAKVTTSTHTNFFDSFSNETLTSQQGADQDGTLDFYELHFYPSYDNAPYLTDASVYNADRPIIIGEFDLEDVEQESNFQTTPEQSISAMLNNGYAGAWPWSLATGNVTGIQAAITAGSSRAIDRDAVEACIASRDSSCYKE